MFHVKHGINNREFACRQRVHVEMRQVLGKYKKIRIRRKKEKK